MTDNGVGEQGSSMELVLDVEATKAELALPEPSPDEQLREEARAQVDQLLAFENDDDPAKEASRSAVETMGRDLQQRSAQKSSMLQAPIRELSRGTEDGGPVAKSLVDLRIQVEALDPASVDLDPGGFTRLIGKIPGIGTPLKRYFMKFESSQTAIDSIVKSLEKGREQLKRDNVTLAEDQRAMRELTVSLTQQVSLAQALDEMVVYKLDREISPDDPKSKFVEEEILFVLRQRTMDLQQQLAVNQQGVLATELVIRNNRELIRGVDRAIDVTVSALQVAVTVALALAHQKIVLDKITAVNKTTSDMIAGTAERLKTQGTQIHEQAASAMLDMDALRSAFEDITIALDEVSRFRREALPKMAGTIVELDDLTGKGEEALQRLDDAREAQPKLDLQADE